MLSSDIPLFETIIKQLTDGYGPTDLESPIWPWERSDYYQKEMGAHLKRKFIFFEKLISPDDIAGIKIRTNTLEKQYLNPPFNKGVTGGFEGGRRINLDPGYLDSAKLVLVSTKDFSHRVYLRDGIYGEVTLIYSGKNYQILPYTFPDFRTPEYHEIFKAARKTFQKQVSLLKSC